MAKFKINDRIKVANFGGTDRSVKNGSKGRVVQVNPMQQHGQTYEVHFFHTGDTQEVFQDFLVIDDSATQTKVIHHVSTEYGFTESFDDDQIKTLLKLHLIFHNRTVLLDGITRKIYSNLYDTNYRVDDKRSVAALTLEQQYPRDKD
jgi:hypothetical protein